jgi:hypothetical protein
VPGLLLFSLRLLVEVLLAPVRAARRLLGAGRSRDGDRYEPAMHEPTPVPKPPTRRPAPRRRSAANIHLAEPWPGYDGMRLDELLGRLQGASDVELAVVRAYEREHEARQAVLLAAGEDV